MNKLLERSMKYVAGIGALNIGTAEFLNFDVLSFVPDGIVKTIAIGAIAVSGGFIVYWAWKKKI